MRTQIEIRPARADDKGGVLAFCQNTFSWGDYIPEVWDTWLSDTHGQMLVGQLGGQVVGLVHVVFLESGAAWMEGMRVHPDFRRRGVGSTLDSAGRKLAREKGSSIARLVTSAKNIAAQKALATEGYACIAHFNEWEAKPTRRKFSAPHIATRSEADGLLRLWQASIGRIASKLLPDPHWHWDALTRARLLGQIERGEVRITDGGFAFLLGSDENESSGLNLQLLAGEAKSMFTLAQAARGEAHYRGYPHVEAILVDYPQVNSAMERAGFRREGEMLVYEQAL